MREQQSQLIIQSNNSVIVTPGRGQEKNALLARTFGELSMMIAAAYLYRLSSVALWGSAARGVTAAQLLADLETTSQNGVPAVFAAEIADVRGRYGALRLETNEGGFRLVARDPDLPRRLGLEAGSAVRPKDIGRLKLAAAKAGWPIVDASRRSPAARLDIQLRGDVSLRPYQQDAVESLRRAGSGVVLLPCGAGKTVVGIAALCQATCPTIILTPSRSVAEQWGRSLIELTTVDPDLVSVSESGAEITPITIATYQAATMGNASGQLLDYPWDLVIYDEVQSLPADVFRQAAAFQTARRLGLTATLVREDGKQQEVFALVGPAVYQLPWTDLESLGWIAPARCAEVRTPPADSEADLRRYKLAVVQRLLALHEGQPTLIVGTTLDILKEASERFNIPMLSGKSASRHRDETFQAFREGLIDRLILSRIGSLGIDLPSAEVLIQLNGMFGSRQEEAQRLGRVLRPRPGKVARFYTVVAERSPERRYAEKRQLYLVEQGYSYDLVHASELPRPVKHVPVT
ncbi:DEAD/DEAH box helicase [soil metagenome]